MAAEAGRLGDRTQAPTGVAVDVSAQMGGQTAARGVLERLFVERGARDCRVTTADSDQP